MCGIVGYIGARPALPILMAGLHRLEYRGYDSAGIALARQGKLRVIKCQGKVRDLEARLPRRIAGASGIAHTRWATHGEPSDRNAHPHADASGRIAIVHNGIVENATALRRRLEADGTVFVSETDTEVLAHLIAAMPHESLADAVRAALRLVTGAFGIVVIDAARPQSIVAARNGSPVVLGIGEREMFVASDTAALVRHTTAVVHLDDGEIAELRADGYETSTIDDGGRTTKTPLELTARDDAFDKGDFAHFMRKEIAEQPDAVRGTLRGRLDTRFGTTRLAGLEMSARELLDVRRVRILGCGSAYLAGSLGAHLIEQLARIPAHAEAASEFRYRNPVIESDTLYVAVSQSGETFDTLAAVQEVKRRGGRVIGVVNVVGSTIARECGRGMYLHAGPEVAVVATKTFTCTAVAFALLAIHLGRIRDLSPSTGARLIAALEALPSQIETILGADAAIAAVAEAFAHDEHAFFVGRANGLPIAMEGALKLKEVSYLHAEAYPAAELKHGPLALIAPGTPAVVVLPHDDLFAKNVSTIEEIRARRGRVIAITHAGELPVAVDARIDVPKSEPAFDPLLLNIPMQLLAYHVARSKNRDIDQPRNLAKSVTVE